MHSIKSLAEIFNASLDKKLNLVRNKNLGKFLAETLNKIIKDN